MSDPVERLRAAAVRQLEEEERQLDERAADIHEQKARVQAEKVPLQMPTPAGACPICWVTHKRHIRMRDSLCPGTTNWFALTCWHYWRTLAHRNKPSLVGVFWRPNMLPSINARD